MLVWRRPLPVTRKQVAARLDMFYVPCLSCASFLTDRRDLSSRSTFVWHDDGLSAPRQLDPLDAIPTFKDLPSTSGTGRCALEALHFLSASAYMLLSPHNRTLCCQVQMSCNMQELSTIYIDYICKEIDSDSEDARNFLDITSAIDIAVSRMQFDIADRMALHIAELALARSKKLLWGRVGTFPRLAQKLQQLPSRGGSLQRRRTGA